MIIYKLKHPATGTLSEHLVSASIDSGKIVKPMRILEYLLPDGRIACNYNVDPFFYNDEYEVLFTNEVFSGQRELDPAKDSELIKMYEDTIKQARLAKAGIVSASDNNVQKRG